MNGLFFFGRLLIVSLFYFSAFGKITQFDMFVELAGSVGMPFPTIAILGAIFLDLVGGTLLLVGKKYAGTGAALLILFTLIATPFFHNFWAYTPGTLEYTNQINNFMKNVAILGGLICLLWYYRTECLLFQCLKLVPKKQ